LTKKKLFSFLKNNGEDNSGTVSKRENKPMALSVCHRCGASSVSTLTTRGVLCITSGLLASGNAEIQI
jgi:hypothetical protein